MSTRNKSHYESDKSRKRSRSRSREREFSRDMNKTRDRSERRGKNLVISNCIINLNLLNFYLNTWEMKSKSNLIGFNINLYISKIKISLKKH